MKTTLDIDDDLYRLAKSAAALSGRRVKDIVNDGLRLALGQPIQSSKPVNILGCLSTELNWKSINEVMDQLRGKAEN